MHISTDPSRLDLAMIHRFLAEESAWARDIPRATVEKAIANSLCFGGYVDARQIAFARVVSDYATFAYLADVFVVSSERGKGHSRALMEAVMAHDALQGLRRFMLATSTAHGLYAQFGFAPPPKPQIWMERTLPNIYR